MEYRIIRTLTCYSTSDERMVFDVQLQGFDLEKFQREFEIDGSDLMFDCYEVKVSNLPFLQEFIPSAVGINWDFNNYAYFIEAIQN